MSGGSKPNVTRPLKVRSRVSNGRALFVEDIDERSPRARRYRDVLAEIIADLGGDSLLSEGQRQLARRAASVSLEAETIESALVDGKPVDMESYLKIVSACNRTFTTIGLKRLPRDITPSPREYADQFDAKAGTVNVDPREGSVVS